MFINNKSASLYLDNHLIKLNCYRILVVRSANLIQLPIGGVSINSKM